MCWPQLPDGVTRRHASFDGRDVTFLVVPLSHDGWRWELLNDPTAPKNVATWRSELGADIVVNAAYFLAENEPAGFLSIGGVTSGAATWPSAEDQVDTHGYTFMTSIGDDIMLRYLPNAPQTNPSPNSFLSFPTLIANGETLIEKDSGLFASRTMLAENEHGNDYVIISEKEMVTLYGAAQWLAAQPEHFVTAGNLDGGPSTGISIENGWWDVEDASAPVPSVIVGYRDE